MLQRLFVCLTCLSLLLAGACSNYDFTLNDKVIYTPDPLFADYEVPDKALRECIKEAINDNLVTAASQLSAISCTQAGIETLAGISIFSQLEQLTLSSNSISDISELGSLTVLQVLYLDNNQVIDPVPLYQLPALYRVDLSNNPGLLCPPSGSLLRVDQLTLPAHCR